MMRIGVAGAGLIGRRHVELITSSTDCVVAGIAVRKMSLMGVRHPLSVRLEFIAPWVALSGQASTGSELPLRFRG